MTKELLQQALDALIPLANAHFQSERSQLSDEDAEAAGVVVVALQAAIAQPEQAVSEGLDRALKKLETNYCMFERGVQTLDDLLRSREVLVAFTQPEQPTAQPESKA